MRLVYEIQPDEIYNLGGADHVRVSFDMPEYTADVTRLGTVRLLEAIRDAGVSSRASTRPRARRCSAASAAAAGRDDAVPPAQPVRGGQGLRATGSPSTTARPTGMHAINGILFNHESPRRGETFVTRKITRAAGRASSSACRTSSSSATSTPSATGATPPDYVDAMWRMLQQDEPDDYVIATGEMHSVREFLDEAAQCLGMDWKDIVEIDPKYYRPAEVDALCGDASKAREKLGWEPTRRRSRSSCGSWSSPTSRRSRIGSQAAGCASEVSEPDPQFWDGKSVVVTGGAGFLGRAVVRDLERAGRRRRRSSGRPSTTCAIRARRARRSTARPSSSTSPPTSAASASTAPTRRRSSTTT